MKTESLQSHDVERLRAVIFDVDGILYNQGVLRRQILFRIVAAHRTQPMIGFRVLRALSAYRRSHEELRNLEYSSDRQLRKAAEHCGYPVAEVRDVVARWFEDSPLDLLRACIYPGVHEFLQLLVDLRVQCGVFSDYPAELKLAAMGLESYFGYVLCAADVGRQKPDPHGILTMARQMGVEPACVLYVGDRAIDIEAAARAGAQGTLIENKNSYTLLYDRLASRRRP